MFTLIRRGLGRDLTPFDPFNRDIDRFFRNFWNRPWDWDGEEVRAMEPSVNVYEDRDNLVVEAQVPGLKKDDLKLDLESDRLTLRGETRQESEKKDRNYHLREARYGSFERVIPLPYEVQTEKAQAELKDGLLRVTLPKSESAKKQARQIEVKAA